MDNGVRSTWTVIKEFEADGILVEVSSNDSPRPRHTVRVGRRGERGTIPFLPLFIEGQGKVRVVSVAETVAKLLVEAQNFVEERAQAIEDEYLAERISRESRQVEREGKKRRSSGYKNHGGRPKNAD